MIGPRDPDLPPGPDRTPQIMRAVLTKRLRIQGFIVFDHYNGISLIT